MYKQNYQSLMYVLQKNVPYISSPIVWFGSSSRIHAYDGFCSCR